MSEAALSLGELQKEFNSVVFADITEEHDTPCGKKDPFIIFTPYISTSLCQILINYREMTKGLTVLQNIYDKLNK